MKKMRKKRLSWGNPPSGIRRETAKKTGRNPESEFRSLLVGGLNCQAGGRRSKKKCARSQKKRGRNETRREKGSARSPALSFLKKVFPKKNGVGYDLLAIKFFKGGGRSRSGAGGGRSRREKTLGGRCSHRGFFVCGKWSEGSETDLRMRGNRTCGAKNMRQLARKFGTRKTDRVKTQRAQGQTSSSYSRLLKS